MPNSSTPASIAPFQNFEEKSDPSKVAGRIDRLRDAMRHAQVDAYLVPRADRFRGENVPAYDQRLAWLTGFTGSAGMAVVTQNTAALFTDDRYTLQAPNQTDTSVFDVVQARPASAPAKIDAYVTAGAKLGFDPWVFAPQDIETLKKFLPKNVSFVPTGNLIDQIWVENRPKPGNLPLEFLGDNRAGVSVAKKIAGLREELEKEEADAVFLAMPESVCWLFNIRGRDVPQTPFALAYAIVPKTGKLTIFLDMAKIDNEALARANDFDFKDLSGLEDSLRELVKAGATTWFDPSNCPVAVAQILRSAKTTCVEKTDPVTVPKSRKNEVELAGMREAHRRDGVAMVRLLAWLDAEVQVKEVTEIDIVKQLEAFRRQDETLVDISFETISSTGPNGAMNHYRVTDKTNRTLQAGDMMLLDSGGQYLSGTTDITRTVPIGEVTHERKDRYTRVLQGMIDLTMARFPLGTTGAQVDTLARQHLWQVGLNFSHGTGHGVGAFLSVHEGPISISPRSTVPLHYGNIVSNEPGYYEAGVYGIRIENLLHIRESDIGENFCEFETLTLAPIDTRPVLLELLTPEQRDWLNAYNARVLEEIGPLVPDAERRWLNTATKAI